MKLESIAERKIDQPYSWEISGNHGLIQFDISSMICEIVQDVKNKVEKGEISSRFHFTIAEIVFELCKKIQAEYGCRNISFSGGVFQNAVLVDMILQKFKSSKFNLYFNQQVPPNDAGIALGQVYGYLLELNSNY